MGNVELAQFLTNRLAGENNDVGLREACMKRMGCSPGKSHWLCLRNLSEPSQAPEALWGQLRLQLKQD